MGDRVVVVPLASAREEDGDAAVLANALSRAGTGTEVETSLSSLRIEDVLSHAKKRVEEPSTKDSASDANLEADTEASVLHMAHLIAAMDIGVIGENESTKTDHAEVWTHIATRGASIIELLLAMEPVDDVSSTPVEHHSPEQKAVKGEQGTYRAIGESQVPHTHIHVPHTHTTVPAYVPRSRHRHCNTYTYICAGRVRDVLPYARRLLAVRWRRQGG
jgi:hypothetical protein